MLSTILTIGLLTICAAYVVSCFCVWISVSILSSRQHPLTTPISPEIRPLEPRRSLHIPGELDLEDEGKLTTIHEHDTDAPILPPYTPRAEDKSIQLIPPRSAEYGDRAAFLARFRRTNRPKSREEPVSGALHSSMSEGGQRHGVRTEPPPRHSHAIRQDFKVIRTPVPLLTRAEEIGEKEPSPRSPQRGQRWKALLKVAKVKGLLRPGRRAPLKASL